MPTYKDINLLTQKATVAGTEKIPVSDIEYISTEQILSRGCGEKRNYIDGVIVASDGTYSADRTCGLTDFIPVKSGDSVVLHNGFISAKASAMATLYNSDKSFISGAYWGMGGSGQYPERTITISSSYSSAAYIRMSFNLGSGAFVNVNGRRVWTENAGDLISVPIFLPGEYEPYFTTGYVNYSDGTGKSSTANSMTRYIFIKGYQKLRLLANTAAESSDASIAFYDASFTHISSVRVRVTGTKGVEEIVVDVPANATNIRTNIWNEYKSQWFLEGIISSLGSDGGTGNAEVTTNKVTSLSSSSTDTQYPSAKCVYDLVGDVETILASI